MNSICNEIQGSMLTEGLMILLQPTVDQLDDRVHAVRLSQLKLKQNIEALEEELKKIQEPVANLDSYITKLINTKQRVTVLSNVLQNAQERLNKLHISIHKEVVRREIILNVNEEQTTNTD